LGVSSAAFLIKLFGGMLEEDAKRILGKFGLDRKAAMQPIGTLSGGQKSRVILAWISNMNPHFLVLDEPTSKKLSIRPFGHG
jgi:ATP-binding cassette subfamily F protein 3